MLSKTYVLFFCCTVFSLQYILHNNVQRIDDDLIDILPLNEWALLLIFQVQSCQDEKSQIRAGALV